MTIRTAVRALCSSLAIAAAMAIWAAPATAAPGRAYELVTPLDKNGGTPANPTFDGTSVPLTTTSPDGHRVLYSLFPAFLDDAESAGGISSINVATRDRGGWRSTSVSSPLLPPGSGPSPGTAGSPLPAAWSNDLTRIALDTSWAVDPEHDQDRPFEDTDLYLRQPGGRYELLSCAAGQACGAQVSVGLVAGRAPATPDLDHVVFQTAEPLVGTPDTQQVYDRAGANLALVSQGSPTFGGAPLADTAAVATTNATGPRPHAVSADGSRIFFLSPPAAFLDPGRLYVRINNGNNGETIEVSRSHTENPSSATFLGASADGTVALFRSTAALTPDDDNTVADLYAWRYQDGADEDSLQRVAALPQVGPGPSPDNPGPGSGTAPDHPEFGDIVAMSTERSGPLWAYFVTSSGSGFDTSWDLFVAREPGSPSGTVRHVATVGQGSIFDLPCLTTRQVTGVQPLKASCARATPTAASSPSSRNCR